MKGICHTLYLHKNLSFNLTQDLAFSFKNKQANSKSIRYGPMNLSHSCPDFHQEITYPDQQFVTNSSSYWLQFIAQDVIFIWFSFWHLLLDWEHDFGFEYHLCHCLPFFLYWYSIMCQALVQHYFRMNAMYILYFSYSDHCHVLCVGLHESPKLTQDSVLLHRFHAHCFHYFKQAARCIAGRHNNVYYYRKVHQFFQNTLLYW